MIFWMNTAGIIVLYIVVIGLIIFAFVYAGWILTRQVTSTASTPETPTTGGEVPLPQCSLSTVNLKDITGNPCCYENSNETNLKVTLDQIPQFILAPFPTYYLDVCKGFCQEYNSTTRQCTIENENFTRCVNLLKPQQCQGAAMPIAKSGSILYYAYKAGTCSEVGPCL